MKWTIGAALAAMTLFGASAAGAATIDFDQPNNPSTHYREDGFILNGLSGASGSYSGSSGLTGGDYWKISQGSALQVREASFDFLTAWSFTAYLLNGAPPATLEVYVSFGGPHTQFPNESYDHVLTFWVDRTSPQTFSLRAPPTFLAWLIFATPGANSQIAIDNLRLEHGGASGAPEPTTWAMMIAGFGLVGSSLRRSTIARLIGQQRSRQKGEPCSNI